MLRALLLISISCVQAQHDATASLHSATALFKQGNFQDAAATYRAILENDKFSVPAYAGLVQTYLKAGDVAAADEVSVRAINTIPHSGLIHAMRGDVYFRQGLLAEAEGQYRSGLKLDSNCGRALLGLGKIYSAKSANQQAKEYFARAHALDPDDGDALYRWAVLLPFPQSVTELERHLAEYRSTPEEERREREFIELVRGIGEHEVWVGPKEIKETDVKLTQLTLRPNAVAGLGVRVKFAGNQSATMLLDTGSNWMTISRKLAEKIGARKIFDYAVEGVGDPAAAGGYFAWVDKISISEMEFHDCVVHVTITDAMPGLDGIVGTNIFSKYLVTVDFPAHKLNLASLPATTVGPNDQAVPDLVPERIGAMFSFGHVLLLQTSVNNSASGLFVIDSGSNASSISFRLAQRVGKLHTSNTRVVGIAGSVSGVLVLDDAVLKFSSSAQPKRTLNAYDPHSLSRELGTEVSGFIGYDVLSRMKMRVNYRDGIVEFE